jgi:outer membrane protein assembly factor BamA
MGDAFDSNDLPRDKQEKMETTYLSEVNLERSSCWLRKQRSYQHTLSEQPTRNLVGKLDLGWSSEYGRQTGSFCSKAKEV